MILHFVSLTVPSENILYGLSDAAFFIDMVVLSGPDSEI